MLKDVTGGVKQNKTVWIVVSVFIVIVIATVIYQLYKASKAAGAAAGELVSDEVIAKKTNLSVDRVRFLRVEGKGLWDNGVTTIFWIRNYNEEKFINSINKMVYYIELGLLNQFYQEASGETLGDAIRSSFNASDKEKLNPKWLTYLTA